jgi:hypothetical protein
VRDLHKVKPGDWLERIKDPGQTFREYRDQQKRTTLYIRSCPIIVERRGR